MLNNILLHWITKSNI